MDFIDNIRDILISVYLGVGIILTLALIMFSCLLYKALKAFISSATRSMDNVGKVSDAAVEHIVKPLEDGVSFSSVAGNSLGFATGFIAGLRGRRSDRKKKDGD